MQRVVARLAAVGLMTIGLFPGARAQAAQDSVVPGGLRVDPGFEAIGVVWFVAGDDDRDSSLVLEFRPSGTGTWLAAPRRYGRSRRPRWTDRSSASTPGERRRCS